MKKTFQKMSRHIPMIAASLALGGFILGADAFAGGFEDIDGFVAQSSPSPDQKVDGQSTTDFSEAGPRTLKETTLGLTPQLGALGYKNTTGSYSSRSLVGLSLDGNVGKYFISDQGSAKNLFVGVQTGALYSHLGAASDNFFGSNDQGNDSTAASLVIIPADVKVGYYITDNLRASVHGGGNLIYASKGQTADFGLSSDGTSNWKLYPNAGADLEVGVASNVSLIARPDVTLVQTGQAIFTGTVGVTVSAL
jgi:hypothetical protein